MKGGFFMSLALYIVVGFLSLLGILEVIRFCCLKLFSGKAIKNKIVIYPVDGAIEDLEWVVRAIYEREKWDYDIDGTVYLLDLGLDQESKQIVEILQKDLPGLMICNETELMTKIKENLVCKDSRNQV